MTETGVVHSPQQLVLDDTSKNDHDKLLQVIGRQTLRIAALEAEVAKLQQTHNDELDREGRLEQIGQRNQQLDPGESAVEAPLYEKLQGQYNALKQEHEGCDARFEAVCNKFRLAKAIALEWRGYVETVKTRAQKTANKAPAPTPESTTGDLSKVERVSRSRDSDGQHQHSEHATSSQTTVAESVVSPQPQNMEADDDFEPIIVSERQLKRRKLNNGPVPRTKIELDAQDDTEDLTESRMCQIPRLIEQPSDLSAPLRLANVPHLITILDGDEVNMDGSLPAQCADEASTRPLTRSLPWGQHAQRSSMPWNQHAQRSSAPERSRGTQTMVNNPVQPTVRTPMASLSTNIRRSPNRYNTKNATKMGDKSDTLKRMQHFTEDERISTPKTTASSTIDDMLNEPSPQSKILSRSGAPSRSNTPTTTLRSDEPHRRRLWTSEGQVQSLSSTPIDDPRQLQPRPRRETLFEVEAQPRPRTTLNTPRPSTTSSTPRSIATEGRTSGQARVKRPLSSATTETAVPLRQIPMLSLKLSDYKRNENSTSEPLPYEGSGALKDQRMCPSNCTRPECCGGKVTRMMEIGGTDVTKKTDREAIMEQLGPHSADILATYPAEMQQELVRWAHGACYKKMIGAKPTGVPSNSPPHYWDMRWPPTPDKAKAQQEEEERMKQRIIMRWREAMRPDGLWKFRDE